MISSNSSTSTSGSTSSGSTSSGSTSSGLTPEIVPVPVPLSIPNPLKKLYEKNECMKIENKYSPECNKFLLKKELTERNDLDENNEYDYLYPNLNDSQFNIKIAEKKEFNDTKYDGTIYDIKEHAEMLKNTEFELAPYQMFIRNFLSSQTPYNSLLLYAGLGSGKCHAKGTSIMLSSGEIKLVEDIEVGDLLMGDDSTPRTVLSLARGQDKMYEVVPVKGDKYIVNSEHILCLKVSGYPSFLENKKRNCYQFKWIEDNIFRYKQLTYNQINKDIIKKEAESVFKEIKHNLYL